MKGVKLLILIIIVIIVSIGVLIPIGNKRSKSVAGGIVNGNLTVCPSTPNCVSSVEKKDNPHYFSPIPIQYNKWVKISSRFSLLPNAQIVTQTENYAHILFKTGFFRFRDDVEFLYNENLNRLDMRSASRIGRSDFGANRKRMTELVRQIRQ